MMSLAPLAWPREKVECRKILVADAVAAARHVERLAPLLLKEIKLSGLGSLLQFSAGLGEA